jgi:MFS transporter, putative metabolite:H+ symporter
MGRPEEARKSVAWALQIDPKDIELPGVISEVQQTSWLELFKYPRRMAVTVLTSLGSQTAGNGIGLWRPPYLCCC